MNEKKQDSHSISFARTFLLPALWIFVLPLFTAWFANHQLDAWSARSRQSFINAMHQKGMKLSTAQTIGIQGFDIGKTAFHTCGTFGFFHNPGKGGSGWLCHTGLQFAWALRLSLWLLLLAFLTILIVGAGQLWAKFVPTQQHRGFQLGWFALRFFGVAHILGQGLLTVFLSFWVTAIWMNVYVPKLIFLAVIIAAIAAFMSIKALFATSPNVLRVHGLKLSPAQAPALVEHIEKLAAQMETTPPDNIVVGIDDSFFVTEAPFLIHEQFPSDDQPYPSEQEIQGRSLFVSLPLMRVLEKEELDGVLAHELAHFVAGDTALMNKLNVQLQTFDSYMGKLTESFTWGVASCLIAFRAIFELISQGHSRRAEFRADARAADATSVHSIVNSLLKVVVFSTYRHKTESELMEAMSKNDHLRISDRVSHGFAAFLDSPQIKESLLQEEIPHPFDSHPPLRDRIAQFGIEAQPEQLLAALAPVPSASWDEAIHDAEGLETKLWDAYEAQFQSHHELIIALRLRPTNREEREHVERFFPDYEHFDKKGNRILIVSWWGLTLQDGETIDFDDVDSINKQDGTFYGESLVIQCHDQRKIKVPLGSNSGFFLSALHERWQRHHIALEESKANPKPEE